MPRFVKEGSSVAISTLASPSSRNVKWDEWGPADVIDDVTKRLRNTKRSPTRRRRGRRRWKNRWRNVPNGGGGAAAAAFSNP